MTSDKIPAELRQAIHADPNREFKVILHVTKTDPAIERRLKEAGCHVRHRLTLMPCYAVTAPGRTILELAQEPWVTKVELDQPVHTL